MFFFKSQMYNIDSNNKYDKEYTYIHTREQKYKNIMHINNYNLYTMSMIWENSVINKMHTYKTKYVHYLHYKYSFLQILRMPT